MNSHIAGRRTTSLLIVLGLAAAAVGLVWNLSDNNPAHWTLLAKLSAAKVGPGRLFRASSTEVSAGDYQKSVADAELARLTMPDSDLRRRIEALIDTGTGQIDAARDKLQQLVAAHP